MIILLSIIYAKFKFNVEFQYKKFSTHNFCFKQFNQRYKDKNAISKKLRGVLDLPPVCYK